MKTISKVNGIRNEIKTVSGTMMLGRLGMTTTVVKNGSVRLMIGLVTGLGLMTTGVVGPMMALEHGRLVECGTAEFHCCVRTSG